jgi:hypothetical protein
MFGLATAAGGCSVFKHFCAGIDIDFFELLTLQRRFALC